MEVSLERYSDWPVDLAEPTVRSGLMMYGPMIQFKLLGHNWTASGISLLLGRAIQLLSSTT